MWVYLICALHTSIQVLMKKCNSFNVLSYTTLSSIPLIILSALLLTFSSSISSLFKVHQPESHIGQTTD